MTKSLENIGIVLPGVTWRIHACLLFFVLASQAILPEIAPSQQSQFAFQHISIEQGLSDARIRIIMQDSRGFLWIGTDYGLNRYDGRTFKVFIHDLADSLSLSGTTVSAIYEDHFKKLWIGTQSGLNRFDYISETFEHFIPVADDSTSISHANIAAITQSLHDTSSIWISTGNGLNKLDLSTGKFTRFLHDPANPNTLSVNDLRFILEDDSGFFWIGTWRHGVNRFDPWSPEEPVFTRYNHDPANPHSIGANSVRVGAKDTLGTLWFGTWAGGGIYKYNPQSGQFTRFQQERYNPNSFFRGSITYLFIDSNGIIWICDGVLIRFNPQDESFVHIKFHHNQGSASSSYTPITVYEDRSHNLWIGTSGSGLYKLDLKPQKYRHYTHQAEDPKSLIDDDIRLFHEDQKGLLWIATRNNGLDRFDPDQEIFTHFKYDPTSQHSLNHNSVQVLLDDSDGYIWAGTPAGLNRIDPRDNSVDRFLYDPTGIIDPAKGSNVEALYEDRSGVLWIGTFAGDLYRFDLESEKRTRFTAPIEADETQASEILDIYEDYLGNLWIAAWKAFYRFDRSTGEFIRIQGAAVDDNGKLGEKIYVDRNKNIWGLNRALSTLDLTNFTVIRYRPFPNVLRIPTIENKYNKPYDFFEDSDGMIWCGTKMGLHKFDPQQRKFITHYFESDGLLSNYVLQITGDDFGNIWVLTNRGISIFNEQKPAGEQFISLGTDQGISNNPTLTKVFLKSKAGDVYWGGSNGMYRFFPAAQNTNPNNPAIRLTGFKIFNQPAKLDTSISEISIIRLDHDKNFFSFSFAALDFSNPLQNQYAYKLEGIDENWVKSGNKNEAGYTNLPPGRYVFKVRASNNDGIWNNDGASVRIIIAPPWWQSSFAYAIYLFMIAVVLCGLWRFQTNRVTLRNELKMRQFEANKLQEIDRMKSRFFVNISHEFRTPLTLILGPVEQMLSDDFKGNLKENYRMILRNSRRLLRLINQLLDLSKLEAGRMSLQARAENIVPLLKGLVLSFASLAERKKITLSFHAEPDLIEVYIDRDKLEKIVTNLLSNAFKVVTEDGKIQVTVAMGAGSQTRQPSTFDEFIEIAVADTGPGIEPENLEKIFDRFYQGNEIHRGDQEGSGIGLALTKELVELHHGEIHVESRLGEGTTFVVRLPTGRGHLDDDEIIAEKEVEPTSLPSASLEKVIIEDEPVVEPEQESTLIDNATLILIVEDNRDVRYYIRQHLEENYTVCEAENGARGVELAQQIIPDLIISDVMMPVLDGYELCQALKNDEKTSHIPIILLTAKASAISKVEGLEIGADDYLVKPFDSRELLARVKNLIKQRKALRQRFSREVFLKPQEIAITPMDAAFLEKLQSVVEKHIGEEDFTVEMLGYEAGMSRTQIHRKLRALIDQSASQFIRSMRLSRGAELLRQNVGTVTEIAYMVGFGSQAYFSKCFHDQFGCAPREYK